MDAQFVATEEKEEEEEAEEKKWAKSLAKAILLDGLYHERIPLWAKDMMPRKVYELDKEFQKWKYVSFRGRLNEYRKQIRAGRKKAEIEDDWLRNDRKIYPKPPHNENGEPRWEGSRAEQWIQIDLDDGSYPRLKPRELYAMREDYQDFSLTTVRKHFHQEIKKRKFINYLRSKDPLTKSKKPAA